MLLCSNRIFNCTDVKYLKNLYFFMKGGLIIKKYIIFYDSLMNFIINLSSILF